MDEFQKYRIEVLTKATGVLDAIVKIQTDINDLNDRVNDRSIGIDAMEAEVMAAVSTEMTQAADKTQPKPKFGNSDAREAEVGVRLAGNIEFVRLRMERQHLQLQVRSKNIMLNSHQQQVEVYKAFLRGS